MKLYFSPGACSLSPHIVLREAGIAADLEQVDLKTKKTKNGADFAAVNPKGQVPTLVLDNGQTLTEGPAIVQYLADQKPQSGLAPQAGTFERYRLQEWLNFITAELHKPLGALFNPATPEDYKPIAKDTVAARFAYVDRHLASGGPFLMGSAVHGGGRLPVRDDAVDEVLEIRSRSIHQGEGLRRTGRRRGPRFTRR